MLTKKIKELEEIIECKNKELLVRLESEEKLLKEFESFIYKYNRLEVEYRNILKKYELLSNAKLGKLTLKYWKIKKRVPPDF